MPELIKIYWRDIPSQVTAKAGRKTAKVMLPARFQEAIDRAAMRAGKGSSDAYMEDWRRDRSPCGNELQAAADTAAAELLAYYNDTYLEALTKAKGIADEVKEELRPADPDTGAASVDVPGD
ncbi:MAG: virulence factor [Granulosicoccus sp.]